MSMRVAEQIRGPVSRVRRSFAMQGERLVVDTGVCAGAPWVAGLRKRYRDETVFVSPPRIVQRVLVALLARDVRGPGNCNPNDDVER